MRHAQWIGALVLVSAVSAAAQTGRVQIFLAEDRRAPTARDLAIIRAGTHSEDAETVRIAVRALGRLERPSLVPDIIPSLKNPLKEIRAEAANAVGQALHGVKSTTPRRPAVHQAAAPGTADAAVVDSALAALTARLNIEAEPTVRATICETLGRLPYGTADQVSRAERAILDRAKDNPSIFDRLGIAQGLSGIARLHEAQHPLGGEARVMLVGLLAPRGSEATTGARIRRLAMEALIAAGKPGPTELQTASIDPDSQVRRLAMRAAAAMGPDVAAGWGMLSHGLMDDSPWVRLEAVRGVGTSSREERCSMLVGALKDRDTRVDLMALDQLASCSKSEEAVTALVRTANDASQAESPRGWHRAAHAIGSLAAASPENAAAPLAQFSRSSVWQLRMYAARAATTLRARPLLEQLTRDENDNVIEAAIEGLAKMADHSADALYIDALSRSSYQAIHAAALALDGTPAKEPAIAALTAAGKRLIAEGHDNSHDARDAIAATLSKLGAAPLPAIHVPPVGSADLSGPDLGRLASARARVTIRGLGAFELALFVGEAPATVLRFVSLAESGYYSGLTFHRVVPNFVIQGGSPGANELVGEAMFMRDELGLWPHVRGAVGISTRGRDTGDAQIFIDLLDNPRLDHEYTVFAQVLNGIEVVDQVLEGDVIDGIEILRGP